MDSRQFVVFSDRPSTPYSPRRCSVRVSSSPSFRLPAADWFLQLATQRLEGCFRHQLLLLRPYLVLTKPLRLDIQCQRGASVKIGWKYLDD